MFILYLGFSIFISDVKQGEPGFHFNKYYLGICLKPYSEAAIIFISLVCKNYIKYINNMASQRFRLTYVDLNESSPIM